MSDPLAQFDALESCWCCVCHDRLDEPVTFMILCPSCGNKRCPKATNHHHRCSGSNTSGQLGSSYGNPCPDLCCHEYNAAAAERRVGLQAELAALRAGSLPTEPRQEGQQ